MTRFEIITRDNVDYVVDHINKYILKVIPYNDSPEDGYPIGAPVVNAELYPAGVPINPFEMGEEEFFFYGLDINYYDSYSRNCNKELWNDAINFYFQLKFNNINLKIAPVNIDCDIIEQEAMEELKEWIALGPEEVRSDDFYLLFIEDNPGWKNRQLINI